MEKIDKGLENLHNYQRELDHSPELNRRTEKELEAIKLITEGKHKEAMEVLASLDDKDVKDFLRE